MKNQNNPLKLMTDSELVAQFKQGNEAAFNALYYKYQLHVYAFVLSLSKDRHVAEEVTQITFLKVFENIQTYTEKSKFKAWVLAIAYNNFINIVRGNKKHVFMPLNEKFIDLKPEFFADHDSSVEKAIEINERDNILHSFIQELPSNQSLVISLLLEGMKYEEVSKLLCMNLNTVKTSRFHGVRKLRKIYGVAN